MLGEVGQTGGRPGAQTGDQSKTGDNEDHDGHNFDERKNSNSPKLLTWRAFTVTSPSDTVTTQIQPGTLGNQKPK